MKRESFQKKRRPTGGGLFVFHTKTRRRKKHRVAAGASADLGSEVPNLGVARALAVILVLHVAAIAAIFIHNRVTDEDAVVSASGSPATAAAIGNPAAEKLPVLQKGENFYFVATGDTYERIAGETGVSVEALRDLNNNMKLKAGRIMRIPAGGVTPPKSSVAANANPAPAPAGSPTPPAREPVAVAPAAPAPAPATLVRPNPNAAATGLGNTGRTVMVQRTEPAPSVRVGRETSTPPAVASAPPSGGTSVAIPVSDGPATGTYTVKQGDTAWGISKRHKVSVAGLLKANGISDARKLRPGMKLKIPAN